MASLGQSFLGSVIISLLLFALSNAQTSLSVNEERPCPETNVTFTCTVSGSEITWQLPNLVQVTLSVNDQANLNMPRNEFGYIVEAVGLNSSSVTSTLIAAAEDGLTMGCEETMSGTQVGSITLQLASRPSPPLNLRHLVLADTTPTVSIQWDPATDNGGSDELVYTVSISPSAQLSSSVISMTYVTVYPDLSVRYTVSIVSTTCAGNSTASEYVFTVCPPSPPVSIGAAVGITVALCFVFFLGAGIFIGLLIAYCCSRCNRSQAKSSGKMSPAHVPQDQEDIKLTEK